MKKSFEDQIFKVKRVVDKIELAIDEMIQETREQNFDPLNPEGINWIYPLKEHLSGMINNFLRSYILSFIKISFKELMQCLEKYYCILPLENIQGQEIYLEQVMPVAIQKRKEMRKFLLLDYVEGEKFTMDFENQKFAIE